MAKYYGSIGFAKTIEKPTGSGIYVETILEKKYKGDILKNNRRWENSGGVNDDFTISNQISIISDNFVIENLYAIKYVKWMGVAWKISNIEIQRPRLLLTLGGVYNGEQNGSTC